MALRCSASHKWGCAGKTLRLTAACRKERLKIDPGKHERLNWDKSISGLTLEESKHVPTAPPALAQLLYVPIKGIASAAFKTAPLCLGPD